MSQTVNIGDACFVRLNGRVFPGIVVGFWSDTIKGGAVRVETEAAPLVHKPWRTLSFWLHTAWSVTDKNVTLIVPQSDGHRAELEHEVANPPLDERVKWLARQCGELPLQSRAKKVVGQFPSNLEPAISREEDLPGAFGPAPSSTDDEQGSPMMRDGSDDE